MRDRRKTIWSSIVSCGLFSKMFLSAIKWRNVVKIHRNSARSYFARVLANEEYTEQPDYPEIKPPRNYENVRKENMQKWQERIKMLSTVEEKLFEVNMPRYYGWKCVMLNDDKLPSYYANLEETAKNLVKEIKEEIEDGIVFEYDAVQREKTKVKGPWPDEIAKIKNEELLTSAILCQINRILINALSSTNSHLTETEVDINPRHETYWVAGGMQPPTYVKKEKTAMCWKKHLANEPVDRHIQFVAQPYLTLRHKSPLEPILDVDVETLDVQTDGIDIPVYKFEPQALGYHTKHRHGTTIPGFWPGDQKEFGLVQYQRRSHLINRHTYCLMDDKIEALHSQGILSSYAWTLGQACYQGFGTFTNPTYPLITQTVITNGQNWSFYVYQLNTTLHFMENADENKRYNLCWGTKEMKLFDKIDENGKLIGFNEDVLVNLVKFYMNQPKTRDYEMKPYLCKVEPKIANILDDERRDWIEKRFKHLFCNRPRDKLAPEIFMWEKIYKIDHNTMPMDARRRFFELGQKPYHRRLDDHLPVYIPRVVREGGIFDKKKWRKDYYPNVRRKVV